MNWNMVKHNGYTPKLLSLLALFSFVVLTPTIVSARQQTKFRYLKEIYEDSDIFSGARLRGQVI